MSTVQDWRAEARRLGFFGIGPLHPDRSQRHPAYLRLRQALLRQADRALLFAWRSSWIAPVPDTSRPAWAAALDAAPWAGPRPLDVKLLDRALLLAHADELAVVKPWVRWSALTDAGIARREAASPGEVLLEFGAEAALSALAEAIGADPWHAYAVTQGTADQFSSPTWRSLRDLRDQSVSQSTAPRLLMALTPNSHATLCFGDSPTIGRLLDGLEPLLHQAG